MQIMAKNVRKRNELSFGLLLENFSFLKRLPGVHQVFVCLKQNLLQSQTHERGPIDVSSLLFSLVGNGQHAQPLTIFKRVTTSHTASICKA